MCSFIVMRPDIVIGCIHSHESLVIIGHLSLKQATNNNYILSYTPGFDNITYLPPYKMKFRPSQK